MKELKNERVDNVSYLRRNVIVYHIAEFGK